MMETPDLRMTVDGLMLVKHRVSRLEGFAEEEEVIDNVISLLKEQEPQPPKHIHEEYPEHDWVREEDGSIDEFATASDLHNGPRCKRCYDSFCVHCEPNGYETHKPCIVDEDRCPKCGNKLFPPWGKARKITYCKDCGQEVKWDADSSHQEKMV